MAFCKYNLIIFVIIIYLFNSITKCSTVKNNNSRAKRQEEGTVEEESRTLVCDFGSGSLLSECSWTLPPDAHLNVRWNKGQGATAYWLGGPLIDHTLGDVNGGYIYFETSYKVIDRVFSSASLESSQTANIRIPVKNDPNENINRTIQQNINQKIKERLLSPKMMMNKISLFKQPLLGLSLLDKEIIDIPNVAHFYSPNISRTGAIGHCVGFYYNIDGLSANNLRLLVRDMESDENQTLWESRMHTDGHWIKAEIVYTYESYHQIILEGIAKSASEPERAYRGYVAIDDIQITPLEETEGVCHGHCTFEGGTCGWKNEEDDDFDWKQSRGSDNFFTGPVRDYYSFSREYPLGAFIYIDANYPRRPGDKALLISPLFQPTENGPICFKFATHMYGNGVGTLRVKYRSSESDNSEERILWEMSGEAGNNWYSAQLPIASSTSFNIIFEGIIGPNYLGNIAIDSISIEQGVCPVSPQTAARKSGDCTFEEGMCDWTNPLPQSKVDDFDWIRQFSYGNYGPKTDHTKKNRNGYFLSLNGDVLQPMRGGTSAWIVSPEFAPTKTTIKCISFYYFMYQRVIETGGPSLGGLRVYIRTIDNTGDTVVIPIWKLNNHQSLKWRRAQVPLVSMENNEFQSPTNNYQVVIEGIWGDARVGSIALDDISFFDGNCKVLPENALAIKGECSFDKGLCGWKNETKRIVAKPGQSSSSGAKDSLIAHKNSVSSIRSSLIENRVSFINWRLATLNSRPSNLQDHTFRAPVGYAFFDVFNQNTLQTPILRSPKFPALEGDASKQCLSFWFSGFGRGESTTLNIYSISNTGDLVDSDINEKESSGKEKKEDDESRILLWSIQTRFLETRRNLWYYGQVTVNAESPFQVIIEGMASDGGYAIDDITFFNGTCQIRPKEAKVILKTESEI